MRAVVIVALVAGCSDRTSSGTSTSATAGSAAGERLLRYQAANMTRYRVDVAIKTPPGAAIPIDIARTVELELSGDDRFVRARIAADDPLAAYDVRDGMDAAVLLFPELPKEPVAPGEIWNVARGIMVPGREQPLDLAHYVVYVRDQPCKLDGPTCAQLELGGRARNATVRIDNTTYMVLYGFNGWMSLDTSRGRISRAELHVDVNLASGPINATARATLVATPRD